MFREEEALEICEEIAKKNKVDIDVLGATQEEDKIIFLFSSSEKIELKNLRTELCDVLQTNVQLKKINPRQKAKKIGGLGKCGLKLCCSTWLKETPAKKIKEKQEEHNFNYTSNKIGACGRPLCCLLYGKCAWDKEKPQEQQPTADQPQKPAEKEETKKGKGEKKKNKKEKRRRIRRLKI